eukprot:TRINITY_DN3786_c0_g2_i4.p1 TRINITY_DN3786_c0_g2~~TRINITY_DN3786_c0_g2_i4.p1  ORF type:complete len:104 (+),score=26.15 TRINITY_DN3786_c0_g2_i4:158-469(+)
MVSSAALVALSGAGGSAVWRQWSVDLPIAVNWMAFYRCGSVTAAADELGVSSGAISQQLHKIEHELGVKLLKRDGRSLTLTSWEIGRAVQQECRDRSRMPSSA